MIPNKPSRTNYNNVGTRNNGFQYKILPLSFNLQLRGNCNTKLNTKRINVKLGDIVKGVDIINGETYTGHIIDIKYNKKCNPIVVTIMDNNTRKNINLFYESVVKLNLKESHSIDFDNLVKRYLI